MCPALSEGQSKKIWFSCFELFYIMAIYTYFGFHHLLNGECTTSFSYFLFSKQDEPTSDKQEYKIYQMGKENNLFIFLPYFDSCLHPLVDAGDITRNWRCWIWGQKKEHLFANIVEKCWKKGLNSCRIKARYKCGVGGNMGTFCSERK